MRKIVFLFIVTLIAGCAVNKPTKITHPYTGGQVGCGMFSVYKLTEDNQGFISIAFKASEVEWQPTQMYAIGKTPILEVKRKSYEGTIDHILCNDLIAQPPTKSIDELATGGILEIRVAGEEIEKAKQRLAYKVTLILKGVTFGDAAVDYLKIENVNVGWLPG